MITGVKASDREWHIGRIIAIIETYAIVQVAYQKLTYFVIDDKDVFKEEQIIIFKYISEDSLKIFKVTDISKIKPRHYKEVFAENKYYQEFIKPHILYSSNEPINSDHFIRYGSIDALVDCKNDYEIVLLENRCFHNIIPNQIISFDIFQKIVAQTTKYVDSINVHNIIKSYQIDIRETFQNPPGKDAYHCVTKYYNISSDDTYIRSLFPSFDPVDLAYDSPVYYDDYQKISDEEKSEHYTSAEQSRIRAGIIYSRQQHIDYLVFERMKDILEIKETLNKSDILKNSLWPQPVLSYRSINTCNTNTEEQIIKLLTFYNRKNL